VSVEGVLHVAGHGGHSISDSFAAGLASTALTGPLLDNQYASTKQRPFPHRRLCCPLGSSSTSAASPRPPGMNPLPGGTGDGALAPAAAVSASQSLVVAAYDAAVVWDALTPLPAGRPVVRESRDGGRVTERGGSGR